MHGFYFITFIRDGVRERREDCPIFLEDSVGGALLLISASKPDVQILTVEYRSRSESTAAMT